MTRIPLALLALALALAAGKAVAENPVEGAVLFKAKCGACHDRSGWGTRTLARRVPADQAELAERAGLTADYVKYVIRHGIGSMPQFTPTDLTDSQVRQLGAWLEQVKARGNRG